MFKFIHAADIHLDSPLLNLEQYDGAPIELLRSATRSALENLVALALDEQVAFVLIAGDVYDGDWDSTRTGLHFRGQMAKLGSAGIKVYVIAGNHDAKNKMTKQLRPPDNVYYFSEKRPETIELPEWDVKIHGQSFAKAAVLENLALQYPEGDASSFHIGLLHTCATGSGHEPYAPCKLDDLKNKGYQYWALGHIHQREILSRDPFIAFSGNLQGRHIRETGSKGCFLISVDDSRNVSEEFRSLDVLRWEVCRVDVTSAVTGDDVLEAFLVQLQVIRARHGDMPLALRVELHGTTATNSILRSDPHKWGDEIRGMANEHGDETVWIEQVKIRTQSAVDLTAAGWTEGPLGELQAVLMELSADAGQLNELAGELEELRRKLPNEVKTAADAPQLEEAAAIQELLAEVGPLLMSRLTGAK